MITVINKITGELYELADDSPDSIKDSWLLISETIKALERAKDKLKPKVADIVDAAGLCVLGDYQFRQSIIQRKNYDKTVMRQVLDEDTLDLFLVPDKSALDEYLKENIDTLGSIGTELRNTMLPIGLPYTTVKLEKLRYE